MIRPIFAANWKMNHGPTDARAFLRQFIAHYPKQPDRSTMVFPSALALPATVECLRERPDILVGVQNIHWEDTGAFTGENSATIARDAGARVVLIGHSERRHVFGETDDQVARKCAAAVRANLAILLCVGETLPERERGEAEAVVRRQLRAALAMTTPAQTGTLMLAYEPVWAIGTGKNATPDDASAIHEVLRAELRELLAERGSGVSILYGGSVNRGNAASLLGARGVDGLLVGGASLDATTWASIVRT